MAPRRGAFKKRRTTNRRKFRKGGPSKLGYTSLTRKIMCLDLDRRRFQGKLTGLICGIVHCFLHIIVLYYLLRQLHLRQLLRLQGLYLV